MNNNVDEMEIEHKLYGGVLEKSPQFAAITISWFSCEKIHKAEKRIQFKGFQLDQGHSQTVIQAWNQMKSGGGKSARRHKQVSWSGGGHFWLDPSGIYSIPKDQVGQIKSTTKRQ